MFTKKNKGKGEIYMENKKKACRAASMLLASSIALGTPAVSSEAAVITSNATDKTAVIFNDATAYSAGDYVIYDSELYICTEDTQGAWSTAQVDFMQVTKNHEMGKSEELSASYSASKDPSSETSLMAFVANAWQKLKAFFGTDDRTTVADSSNYKGSSVSAKLNYLEEQNTEQISNLSKLQGDVEKSFRFVSSGKEKLANAITGEGGTASSSDNFEKISQSIIALSRAQRQQGKTEGLSEGLAQGRAEGLAQGRTEGLEQGLAQGRAEGLAQGKAEGSAEADGRVNPNSESYKKGLEDGAAKSFSIKIHLTYDGPDCENDYFQMGSGISANHRTWSYQRDFSDKTIVAVYALETSQNPYRGDRAEYVALWDGEQFKMTCETYDGGLGSVVVNQHSFAWNGFSFNVLYKDGSFADLTLKIMYI